MKKLPALAMATVLALTTFGASTISATSQDILLGPVGPRYQQDILVGPATPRYQRPAPTYYQQYQQYDRNDYAYWNGYRGYPYERPGYRYRQGYWYPSDAFAAVATGVIGGIIGGAIANQGNRNSYPVASNHLQWCESRYRSYRASDNSFQPYNGPRQQCISPY